MCGGMMHTQLKFSQKFCGRNFFKNENISCLFCWLMNLGTTTLEVLVPCIPPITISAKNSFHTQINRDLIKTHESILSNLITKPYMTICIFKNCISKASHINARKTFRTPRHSTASKATKGLRNTISV